MYTTAKIIEDNLSPSGIRITSFEITYPRIIMAEINTHRVLAKSSASSRAIPVADKIKDVMARPFVPRVFGKNKSGMQATEDLTGEDAKKARDLWMAGLNGALMVAREMSETKVHKQLANRILEPYSYVTTVITGTEWDNFYKLRNSKEAQPEFEELASLMQEAYKKHVPYAQERYHLPYVTVEERQAQEDVMKLFHVSAARCARVSYKSLKTGRASTFDDDMELCNKLITAGHMSPFDHPGCADDILRYDENGKPVWAAPHLHRHFYGWSPYRTCLEGDSPQRRFAS